MSRSYKATGINLKAIPMGETDRLLTILTVERGLVRVIVPGARKHKSRLGGRSSQFVVNELLIVQGKSLDKLVQAETVRSFPGLSADLARLTASQYLAELVLCQALSDQPQADLFALLIEQLQQLETVMGDAVLAGLGHGMLQLLELAGVAPELGQCSVSQQPIDPDWERDDWRVGFSAASGGIVSLEHLGRSRSVSPSVRMPEGRYAVNSRSGTSGHRGRSPHPPQSTLLSAQELWLMRQLRDSGFSTQQLAECLSADTEQTRILLQRIERLLRQYAEYHFDRTIRSATLIDVCFPIAVPFN
jgi:DNA repair protein RecO (recombination protein O)